MTPDIHPTSLIHPDVTIGDGVKIGPFCVIGSDHGPLHIPFGSIIRSHSVVEGGSSFGSRLETGHHALIRSNNDIGLNLCIGSYSSLEGGARIGDYVRIRGRCEATEVTIGDFVNIYGGTYLTDNRLPPSLGKAPPVICDGAVLCMGVLVIAGVTIGVGAYVGGNEVVRKDVPDAAVWSRGEAKCKVSELEWQPPHGSLCRQPWTRAHAISGSYPSDAWARIAALHRRIMDLC